MSNLLGGKRYTLLTEVVLAGDDPDFGGYLIPEEGHDPDLGAPFDFCQFN